MPTMTSGKLARAAGVRVETLRYYERMGLLPEPTRRPSGYRQYTAEDLAAVRFIKRAQALGRRSPSSTAFASRSPGWCRPAPERGRPAIVPSSRSWKETCKKIPREMVRSPVNGTRRPAALLGEEAPAG
jgi:hypothetical protein